MSLEFAAVGFDPSHVQSEEPGNVLASEDHEKQSFKLSARVVAFCVTHKLHLAACSIGAAWAWSGLLHTGLRPWDAVVIATTVLCVYQWNRLTDVSEDRLNCPLELESAIQNSKSIRIFCLGTATLAVTLPMLTSQPGKGVVVGICLILGFLYGTPLLFGKRLKDIPVLKNLSSGFGWALLTVVYPSIRLSSWDFKVWLAFGYMFTAVVMVEMTWDIRDVIGDRGAGVRSIPVAFGIQTTESLISSLNSLTGVLLVAFLLEGRLSNAWVLVLLNFGLMQMSSAIIKKHTELRRPWSHTLIVLQSVLLFGLGVVAR